ncbi:hypothetical protein ACI2KX_15840 [Ectopseudomonas khazarica]|uniref:hypothetical protein n=1 Tax=Ectopseudomonas khazarica TaxID=2502979 RepID=UPI0038510F91
MAYYIDDYIRLCGMCSLDVGTVWNMHNFVIPSLEREAERYRECLAAKPDGDTSEGWSAIESDLNRLEQAIANGRKRCQREPRQQQLFAA